MAGIEPPPYHPCTNMPAARCKLPALICLTTGLACAPFLEGCRKSEPESPAEKHSVRLIWGPESRCRDESLNAFISQAVRHCVDGNYEEYRLLWRYDHQPTSRRHFESVWGMVEQVEVKALKPLRFRLPNGTLDDQEYYVFQAFITLRDEAVQLAKGRLQDRDVVLLIVRDNGAWRLVPAPAEVRDALAGTATEAPVLRPGAGSDVNG